MTVAAWKKQIRTRLAGSHARRKMLVLSFSTSIFSIVLGGAEVLLPLWATKVLGWDASRWAALRSVRFMAVTVGVILLGALSDRFGQKRIARFCTVAMIIALSLAGICGSAGLWILIPLYGLAVSTVFVNLNTLVQEVSSRRQGLANVIYRSAGMAMGIVAPILATSLAGWWNSYPAAMAFLASGLLLLIPLLRPDGDETTVKPLGDIRREIAMLWTTYRVALGQKHLMRYIVFSLLWLNLTASVGAFAAIRFTQDLRFTDQQFGWISSAAGILTLAVVALSALFMDRIPLRVIHVISGSSVGLGCLLMGINDTRLPAVAGFLLYSSSVNLLLGPLSMWVSRAAGEASRTSAFSVHKVAAALILSVTMVVVGVLERLFGMRLVLLVGGILASISSFGFLLLEEPPRMRDRPAAGER